MSHTPGEWRFVNQCPALYTNAIMGDGHIIAKVLYWSGSENVTEFHANAALIAAAPELLAACEAAHTLLEKAGGKSLSEWHAMVIEKLEAAIKKAKGTP